MNYQTRKYFFQEFKHSLSLKNVSEKVINKKT